MYIKTSGKIYSFHLFSPNNDAHEEENNFLDSDDEEILKNYNEFLSKMAGKSKTSAADCPPVKQRAS